ncbi:unnamed protein product, partial [Oppiella nova]
MAAKQWPRVKLLDRDDEHLSVDHCLLGTPRPRDPEVSGQGGWTWTWSGNDQNNGLQDGWVWPDNGPQGSAGGSAGFPSGGNDLGPGSGSNTGTTVPVETTQAWLDECLKRVNEIRAKHQSPPYALDNSLVNYAKNRCPVADAGHLPWKIGDPGENIAQGYGAQPGVINPVDFNSCAAVMDYWASEEKDYDYAGHGQANRGVVGHFTALVWKESTKIGCA